MNRSLVVVEITMTSLLVGKNKKVTGKNQENPVENRPGAENHLEVEHNYAGIKLREYSNLLFLYNNYINGW
jgi:hypothetical protein